MKVTFTGIPHQIKKEMAQWLSDNQQTDLSETLEDSVTHKLSQHNIRLTQNENYVLPLSLVKQACQLNGRDWTLFKHELEKCGVKQKRTNKVRLLTNLTFIKEEA